MLAYVITNQVNGKQYIGITKGTLKRRFSTHLNNATKDWNFALYNAIRKYGVANFTISEVACAKTAADLKILEKLLIVQFNSKPPNGYNMTDGGDGAIGLKWTDDQIAGHIERLTKKWENLTPEERITGGNNISAAKKGKAQPWCVAIGKAYKGVKRDTTFKTNVSKGLKKFYASLTKEERSTLLTRVFSEEERAATSLRFKEFWTDPITKAVMSEKASIAAKKKWKDPIQIERVRAEMKKVWRKRKVGLLPIPNWSKGALAATIATDFDIGD